MKTKLILMASLLFLGNSCSEDATNFGKTDCYWKLTQELDVLEEEYQDEIFNYVDEDGNIQSTKVCQYRRDRTNRYASGLEFVLGNIHGGELVSCSDSSLTGEELAELDVRIKERIADLEKAVDPDEGVYNCGG